MNARPPLKAFNAYPAFGAVWLGLCMGVALAQSPLPQPAPAAPVLKPSSLLPLL